MKAPQDNISGARLMVLQALVLALLSALGYGFWRLQIVHHAYYSRLARENHIRLEPIPAPRGLIVDRYGRPIVDNRPAFEALLERNLMRGRQADLPAIARGLELDPEAVRLQVEAAAHWPDFTPLIIKRGLSLADIAFIDSHRDRYPELRTLMVTRRLYPPDGLASAMLGYVGIANQRQTLRWHLAPDTVVGKAGLEQFYNRYLMGTAGAERLAVNSRGRIMEQLSAIPPKRGRTLRLTIDNDLQIAAEAALGQRSGAIVALDPRNGQVLAMASRPSFNPNDFVHGIPAPEWRKLLTNPDHPLLNKAIQAQLAPGSVFKLIVAAAGLERGVAQNLTVNCQGGAEFYGHYYKCWYWAEKHKVHGITRIRKAIAESCDTYFYTLGNDLGIQTIAHYAQGFGLGRRTGIDLPHESAGLVPTPAWKMRRFHQPWWSGETISVAIGQGPITATPLQIAHAVGGILESGRLMRPHLAFNGEVPAAEHAPITEPRELNFPLQANTVQTIEQGMARVVQPGGTAASAQLENVDFGGKTGSAQTVSETFFKKSGGQRKFLDNAWFVGAYPLSDPRIVICVLYEHGAQGYYAARIAAQVIASYIAEEKAPVQLKAAWKWTQPGRRGASHPQRLAWVSQPWAAQPRGQARRLWSIQAMPTAAAEEPRRRWHEGKSSES